MVKVGIVGAGGYAGVTLLQILLRHPEVEVVWLMSEEAHKGKKAAELYPHLIGEIDLAFITLDDLDKVLSKVDLIFLALPHGVALNHVPKMLAAGKKVIDLGADYRFDDQAVYGLPELYREQIKKARLIGNPGCYPTASILGLAPLVKKDLIKLDSIIVDAKSGIAGAGRGISLKVHYCERNEGFEAYNVTTHRHMGEIEYQVSRISGNQVKVTFVPHLAPMNRGILATIYAKLKIENEKLKINELSELYKNFYQGERFVKVLDGVVPNTKFVAGTNFCNIAVQYNEATSTVIVLSVIDNLIKGAAGQATQNMNLIYGWPEETGLRQIALYP